MPRSSRKSLHLQTEHDLSSHKFGQAGELLVETLFTIVLVGTGVVAIVAALGVAIGWSTSDRAATNVEVALQSYAEALAAAEYADCDDYADVLPTNYDDDLVSLSIEGIQYWDASPSPSAWTTDCVNSAVQKLELRAITSDDTVARTLTIYKRPQ